MPKFKKKNINIKKIKYGKNVTIYNPSNIYECEIGDNSFIGPFVEIQKGVKIGKNTKIQSHTFICELVKIKNNVFVGHGVMFINDKFKNSKPALGEKKLWDKTEIGNNVSIGSNSTILPIKICDNVVIGAGSVVTKNINFKGVYVGNPAKKIK
jgi:acetyltransferase-like isoleucine patch superfamily enzyme